MKLEIEACPFKTPGYLKFKLPKQFFDRIKKKTNEISKNRKNKVNKELAGNINSSCDFDDKQWFLDNLIIPCVSVYNKHFEDFKDEFNPSVLSKDCKFYLDKLWVNFQKKHEFNPLHNHSGLFSFVIWVKIPYNHKKEHNLSFDVTVQTQSYGTNYTGHLEVGGSIDAWVSSNYESDDDWDSSEG